MMYNVGDRVAVLDIVTGIDKIGEGIIIGIEDDNEYINLQWIYIQSIKEEDNTNILPNGLKYWIIRESTARDLALI